MATINKIDILTPMRIHLSKEIKNREESWQEIVFFDFKNNAVFSINGQRMWEYEKEIEEASKNATIMSRMAGGMLPLFFLREVIRRTWIPPFTTRRGSAAH